MRIGLVPTMGFLHEGHLSLCRVARRAIGDNGLLVLSLYVNPTQFGPTEDLSRYPRNLLRDKALCRCTGVNVLFLPSDATLYPQMDTGGYSTFVQEEQLSSRMEGISRPTHFRGVTTVVAKLFNLVLPEIAVFGAKDYQQAAVIQRMTTDLNIPVTVRVAPTLREADGLALSSRNAFLTPQQRLQAVCLYQAIQVARRWARQSRRRPSVNDAAKQLKTTIEEHPEAKVDYLAFFDPVTLQPAPQIKPGVHFALAVRVGNTRLIDNSRL